MAGSAAAVGISRLPLAAIVRDVGGWPRAQLDPDRLREFRELYADSGPQALPALEVVPDGPGRFLLAEGHHRCTVLVELGVVEVDAVVLAVPVGVAPVAVAFERGLTSAATSSLPLTRADKHAAIEHVHRTRPELSDREIARLVAVSHQTVGRVLRRRRSNGPDTPPPPPGLTGGGGDTPPPPPAPPSPAPPVPLPLDVARRLFRGLEQVREARGLGVWDALTRDHTGDRLAAVLADACGPDATQRAEQFHTWTGRALDVLRRSAP